MTEEQAESALSRAQLDEATVTRLYPGFADSVSLPGLYLAERLNEGERAGRAFVYTNFVASLDGRVSVGDENGVRGVPDSLANPNDWRLYQELAAQADVIITSGRYVRERAAGVAGPMLTYEHNPAMTDIVAWRDERFSTRLPDIAVVSRRLDFDERAAADIGGKVVAIGSASAEPDRVAKLKNAGIAVVLGRSPTGLDGGEIGKGLFDQGYRTAFSAAGPALAHTLIEAGVLDRLYVTQVLEILGGRTYVTLNEGPELDVPAAMDLRSLHLDTGSDGNTAQLFACYSPRR